MRTFTFMIWRGRATPRSSWFPVYARAFHQQWWAYYYIPFSRRNLINFFSPLSLPVIKFSLLLLDSFLLFVHFFSLLFCSCCCFDHTTFAEQCVSTKIELKTISCFFSPPTFFLRPRERERERENSQKLKNLEFLQREQSTNLKEEFTVERRVIESSHLLRVEYGWTTSRGAVVVVGGRNARHLFLLAQDRYCVIKNNISHYLITVKKIII